MNDLKITLLNGVDRYFKHLSNFGKIKNTDKEALIITLFIHQILEGPMSYFIINSDYRIMEEMLYCLNGKSCLIDYSKYCDMKSFFSDINFGYDPAKILEQGDILRFSQDDQLRFHIL